MPYSRQPDAARHCASVAARQLPPEAAHWPLSAHTDAAAQSASEAATHLPSPSVQCPNVVHSVAAVQSPATAGAHLPPALTWHAPVLGQLALNAQSASRSAPHSPLRSK